MRYLLMLAAAASLAACHNRSEDEVGAAPDRGDTTAVTATDTAAVQTDSTMGQRPGATDTSFVQQDSTAAPTGVDSSTTTPSGNSPSDTLSQTGADTTSSTGTSTDSSTMGSDSSSMSMPADSTSQPNQ
jgi:hypothetical protein